jgi:hypothetical protein
MRFNLNIKLFSHGRVDEDGRVVNGLTLSGADGDFFCFNFSDIKNMVQHSSLGAKEKKYVYFVTKGFLLYLQAKFCIPFEPLYVPFPVPFISTWHPRGAHQRPLATLHFSPPSSCVSGLKKGPTSGPGQIWRCKNRGWGAVLGS